MIDAIGAKVSEFKNLAFRIFVRFPIAGVLAIFFDFIGNSGIGAFRLSGVMGRL